MFFGAEKNIQFTFDAINVVKDQINFSGTMINENEKSQISINGGLFEGYKQAEGADSIVGDLKEESGEYNIVLFEIYNAREYSKSIISQNYSYSPHIKLYFTDNNENIYLIETEIPSENKELVTIEKLIQTLGAYDRSENSSSLIEPIGVNNYSNWTGPTTLRSVDNPFVYKNVKLLTGVGAKSTIVNAIIDGNMKGKPSGTKLTMRILEKVYSTALPAAPSLSTIRGWIDDVKDATTSKQVTLGSSSIKLNNGPTVVEGLNQQASYVMHKDTNINGNNSGHHLTLQTTVQYESSTGTPATANGMMRIIWEVYQPASTLYDSDSKELTFSYSISIK